MVDVGARLPKVVITKQPCVIHPFLIVCLVLVASLQDLPGFATFLVGHLCKADLEGEVSFVE
jgi:hypothetical protein